MSSNEALVLAEPTSSQIERYIFLPTVIPTCQNRDSAG